MEKKYCYEYERPALSVDVVALRRGGRGVEVLLITRKQEPFKGKHSFPGGFFDMGDDSIEDSARRELREETGLDIQEITLIGPFSGKHRDPRGRTVTVAYYAWADADAQPKAGDDAASLAWHLADALPEMAFDHAHIMERLRAMGVFE